MKISILTSTYNRANLLDKLYTSILVNSNNSNINIEWLIMDDGSTDNTKTIIENYIKEKIIEIKYYFQENSGKMSALNSLIKKATGDLVLECDSDDFLSRDAINIIEESLVQCKDIGNIYALLFLKYNQNEENMGNCFPSDNYESTMFDLYFKKKITGEKAIVFNTNIRKQFYYELEENEKFITEARMYHKMDLNYHVKCFNKKIMICEYKEDGYSKNINKLFIENPKGYYKYFKEMFEQNMRGVTLKKRLYIYKHYILFFILNNKKHLIKEVKGIVNKICIIILFLPGKFLIKLKIKNLHKGEVKYG